MMGNRTVIVGGSIAGVFTAKELRKNEYQGDNLAKNIIEASSSMFSVIPYFWSDQYEDGFEYLGYIKDWSRTEVEGV